MGVTIKDIAAAAGVSPATVSLALNNSTLVKLETKQKIQELAEQMGYTPNPYARKLVKQKSGMLGLIVPTLQNVFLADLVYYINQIVRAAGYGLTVCTSDNSARLEEKLLRDMSFNMLEGIMLAPLVKSTVAAKEAVENCQTPLIFTASRYPDSKHPYVMSNVRQGMFDLTREVIKSGRKRLVLITQKSGFHCWDLKAEGYLAAAKDVTHDIFHTDDPSYQGGCVAAEQLMDQGYDAILCANDLLALGVLNTLMNHGVRVPEEIGVTGFNNIIFSETSTVPITTVQQDVKLIAEKTVESMLKLIREKECESVLLDCEVIKRRSI